MIHFHTSVESVQCINNRIPDTPTQVHAFHRFFKHILAEDEFHQLLCRLVQSHWKDVLNDLHRLPVHLVHLIREPMVGLETRDNLVWSLL